jgi:hypothetical protein
MQAFLDDYELGQRQGRYVDAELPTLPFENGTFHLALFVDQCVHDLTASDCHVTIEKVPYEFQRGGHEMIRVRPRASP